MPVLSTGMLKSQGRMCESRGDHAGAIRAYLMLEVDSGIDADTLQEAYEKAAELAYKFTPNRATEVVAQVWLLPRTPHPTALHSANKEGSLILLLLQNEL